MSTYEQQQRETEQVVGTLTGVVHKGEDKFQAVVAPDGSQYTKNLWTKDQQVVQFLMSQVGNRIAFACNISHWQRQDGQNVRSYWIDQVGPPSPQSPAMQGPQVSWAPPQQASNLPPQQMTAGQQVTVQPQVMPMQAPGQSTDPREQKIHRQTATKVAAVLLGYLGEDQRTVATLLSLSERLVAYYNDGLPNAETVDDLIQRAMPSGFEDAPQGGHDPDSDIPF
jgi:hypothetical protein